MNRNHQLVNEMMTRCGFVDGAGWANNILIEAALENGALGAKLTGAGGGGSVFALTHPKEEGRVVNAWQCVVDENALENAVILQPKISRDGILIKGISR